MYLQYIDSKCPDNFVQDPVDMVFVIDTSNSVGSSNFQLIREFVASIVTELIRNSPRSSVGVILFDRRAHIHFSLQTYNSLSLLLSVISQLPYNDGGSTNIHDALTLLLSAALSGTLKLRDDSSKIAIVITDGHSSSPLGTLLSAYLLHTSNIFDVFAVGIANADLDELERIASSPKFVFFTSSFHGSNLLQLDILDRISFHFCSSKCLMNTYIATCTDKVSIVIRSFYKFALKVYNL